MSLSVAVAGASGYAGGELLRLLAAHPDFDVATVTAFQNAGQPLASVQPQLSSLAHLTLVETSIRTLSGHDVVFLALPHGKSGELTERLSPDTLVIDCGADHRLTSEADWAAFYGGEYFGAWSYGLPELLLADGGLQRSQLVGAQRIAVPAAMQRPSLWGSRRASGLASSKRMTLSPSLPSACRAQARASAPISWRAKFSGRLPHTGWAACTVMFRRSGKTLWRRVAET